LLKQMDDLSKDGRRKAAVVRDLENKPSIPLLDILLEHGYLKNTQDEAGHIQDDWLDSARGWFKGLAPLEPLLRAAFIQAGKVALEHGLPTASYVVPGHDRVEVAICKSDQQVTVLVLCPRVGPPAGESLPEEDDIWVVR
jgi:hypothetical protein